MAMIFEMGRSWLKTMLYEKLLMFFKKTKYHDQELGEIEYSLGSWFFEKNISSKQVLIEVEGNKKGINPESLEQAKNILINIPYLLEKAENYIKKQDITEFTNQTGEEYTLLFDGIHSCSKSGEFALGFSLSNWEDAYVIVHFEEQLPYAISLGD